MPDVPPRYPNRKTIRAPFYDYCGGDYFVTLCTEDKQPFFGLVHDGEMVLTKLGEFARDTFARFSDHYPYACVLISVVMPNHVHAIIRIKNDPVSLPPSRGALGVVIGGYKQAVTMYARRNQIHFEWQGRYYDHLIRDHREGDKITEYIANNPKRWSEDCLNS